MLIEDGILVGYMQDRQNARLMGMKPTGNGRRQSYAPCADAAHDQHLHARRRRDPEEIIASVKNGIYAVSFGGGQVDITSGKYVFQCTEAYKIEDGKLGAPLKGAMLIGNGPTDLHRVSMIGNDLELDPGIGTCGKNGQGVPVGVGQPTLRMDRITVGGYFTSRVVPPWLLRGRPSDAALVRGVRNTRCSVRRRRPPPRCRGRADPSGPRRHRRARRKILDRRLAPIRRAPR